MKPIKIKAPNRGRTGHGGGTLAGDEEIMLSERKKRYVKRGLVNVALSTITDGTVADITKAAPILEAVAREIVPIIGAMDIEEPEIETGFQLRVVIYMRVPVEHMEDLAGAMAKAAQRVK